MQNQPDPIAPLPTAERLTTIPVLTALGDARAALAELRGLVQGFTSADILLDPLSLVESQASSRIENIAADLNEVLRAAALAEGVSPAAREVVRHRDAMMFGHEDGRRRGGISESAIIGMFRILKQRGDGYRTAPGTRLVNSATGQVVYEPPQDPWQVEQLMRELEAFINAETHDEMHPLIRMALIHHRFESIHPFPDGNGRIGRILNALYLTHADLLDAPILCLSRIIHLTRRDYYRLLQTVRTEDAWEEWVIYMLHAVTHAAHLMLEMVQETRTLMLETEQRLREQLPKIYSQELLDNLFRHPCTRIELLAKDTSRDVQIARRHLKRLTEKGFVTEVKHGRSNCYINQPLVELLKGVSVDDTRHKYVQVS
ncbi:MAG: Fic family protein [Gammaproteobacteria bacterium AqS3]|nr:Fic family protein [Gammaproteobacteria bacterium AqS3]